MRESGADERAFAGAKGPEAVHISPELACWNRILSRITGTMLPIAEPSYAPATSLHPVIIDEWERAGSGRSRGGQNEKIRPSLSVISPRSPKEEVNPLKGFKRRFDSDRAYRLRQHVT